MIWTTEKPTRTGWYWWRRPSIPEDVIVEVYKDKRNPAMLMLRGRGRLYVQRGQWAGPIPEPEEPQP